MAQVIVSKAGEFPRPALTLLRIGGSKYREALPVVIAAANTGHLIEHGTELFKVDKEMAHDFFRTMEIQSSAAAVQNLLLAATFARACHSLALADLPPDEGRGAEVPG